MPNAEQCYTLFVTCSAYIVIFIEYSAVMVSAICMILPPSAIVDHFAEQDIR